MNIISNEKLIRRYSRIAMGAMIGGLLVLVAGMVVSFRYPERFSLSLIALLLGFLLSQIGIYFSNRYGRSPRPDELLNKALKGLDGRYTLYHYSSPVNHLLAGPSGLWVLMPMHQRGTFSFSKGRWRQRGGNLYLRLFAQEGIGRPDLDLLSASERLTKLLSKHFSGEEMPPIRGALVFTNPRAVIEIPEGETPPAATVSAGDLKDTVRRAAKVAPLTPAALDRLEEILAA